jgi:glycosyltransferase involved in cell wall biosynthesis
LLIDHQGAVQQCSALQLLDAEQCQRCVAKHGQSLSGGLHQAERDLCGYGTPEYSARLQDAFARAEGVLAVNPQIAAAVRPFTKSAYVIPSGFDADRFTHIGPPPAAAGRPLRLLFAGLTQEYMKGFHVLRHAAALLWQRRQDFEVWATGEAEPSGSPQQSEPWLKWLGWQSQAELPQVIEACDVLVFPTIAEEALGRTAVEAMACGRPVVASRLGGLSWVVEHERTGLLCAPGDPAELAAACERLLDDAELRCELGEAGREKFTREFTWDAVLARHYVPLLGPPRPVSALAPCEREVGRACEPLIATN